ncbi:hypothetical protein MJ904_24145 [Massilia sp. MB5]|uniref:hypothetical protein n=1 Tax=Massilia sp. MB5 TaxID=2919578 RepID=UPI001F110235|nr:hypothetical protein [Massilia sp. MB5]UMR30069.1 hypothetical protein MJ904_24145 [Massilia sp. MB5]
MTGDGGSRYWSGFLIVRSPIPRQALNLRAGKAGGDGLAQVRQRSRGPVIELLHRGVHHGGATQQAPASLFGLSRHGLRIEHEQLPALISMQADTAVLLQEHQGPPRSVALAAPVGFNGKRHHGTQHQALRLQALRQFLQPPAADGIGNAVHAVVAVGSLDGMRLADGHALARKRRQRI